MGENGKLKLAYSPNHKIPRSVKDVKERNIPVDKPLEYHLKTI
jgi:hypothetical protein